MGIIYVAPLKKGIFLDDMLRTLKNGHHMEFDGAVVVHGNGVWNRQIWETSKEHPSGRKLGELDGSGIGPAVAEALRSNNLVLYAKKYRKVVMENLLAHGYQPVELAYESDKLN